MDTSTSASPAVPWMNKRTHSAELHHRRGPGLIPARPGDACTPGSHRASTAPDTRSVFQHDEARRTRNSGRLSEHYRRLTLIQRAWGPKHNARNRVALTSQACLTGSSHHASLGHSNAEPQTSWPCVPRTTQAAPCRSHQRPTPPTRLRPRTCSLLLHRRALSKPEDSNPTTLIMKSPLTSCIVLCSCASHRKC